MYDRVIAGFEQLAERRAWEPLLRIVCEGIAPDARIEMCRDAEHVDQIWRQPSGRDLLLIDTRLPAGEEGDGRIRDLHGAAFWLAAKSAGTNAVCVLVGATDVAAAARTARWPLCEIMNPTANDADYIERLTAVAHRLSGLRDMSNKQRSEVKAPPCWALIEVNLDDERNSSVSLTFGQGDNCQEGGSSPLCPDAQELKRIVARSRRLRRITSARLKKEDQWRQLLPSWHRAYRSLGDEVFKLINIDMFPRYLGAAEMAAEAKNLRLRFTVHPRAYDVMWESMYDTVQGRWMMLNSTIARRPKSAKKLSIRRLDSGDGKVHMLAIASDVPAGSTLAGPNNPGFQKFAGRLREAAEDEFDRRVTLADVFPPLPDLAKEMAALAEIAREHKERQAGRPLDIEFETSQGAVDGKLLWERVKHSLTTRNHGDGRAHRYDVVHFTGHAIFDDGPDDRGYLIFGDHPTTHAVSISDFAYCLSLAGVQLAYLSCCRSSARRAAEALATNGVPLAIGFTWDLPTADSAEFANHFYSYLLSNDLKICHAFQEARCALRNVHEDDHVIWAAPVLVAQPGDWRGVESCFALAET